MGSYAPKFRNCFQLSGHQDKFRIQDKKKKVLYVLQVLSKAAPANLNSVREFEIIIFNEGKDKLNWNRYSSSYFLTGTPEPRGVFVFQFKDLHKICVAGNGKNTFWRNQINNSCCSLQEEYLNKLVRSWAKLSAAFKLHLNFKSLA